MEHRFEQDKGRLVIRMPRELDHHSSERLRLETERMLARYPVRSIEFDFRDTVFMDSSGIGVILGRCRSLKYAGGHISAVHLNAQIKKIFQVSGLHKVIEVEI